MKIIFSKSKVKKILFIKQCERCIINTKHEKIRIKHFEGSKEAIKLFLQLAI